MEADEGAPKNSGGERRWYPDCRRRGGCGHGVL